MLQGREMPAGNPLAGMKRNKDSLAKFQLRKEMSGHRPIIVASHLDVQLGQSESLGKNISRSSSTWLAKSQSPVGEAGLL